MAKKLELIHGALGTDPVQMPEGLGAHGRELWERVTTEYDLSDAGGYEMLNQICRSADNAAEYHELIDRDGVMIKAKTGMREHPLIRHEAIARAFVVRGLARLGLQFEPLRNPGRPGRPLGIA